MAVTIHDMMQPQVILDVVSRLTKGQSRFASWLGLYPDRYDAERGALTGPNIRETPVRYGSYRIFDRTRAVAMGRAPGTGPATWQPQPIGEVSFAVARYHEKIRLDSEELMNLTPLLGPQSVVDANGQDYITRQEEILVQRFNNAVKMMAAGLLRGKFYLKNSGENWLPTLTAPTAPTPFVTVDYQIPAGNLGQLNMLGTGAIIATTWANAAAPIISHDLPGIIDAFARLTGYVPEHVWTTMPVWAKVITNTEVINSAGSAMTPFEILDWAPKAAGIPQHAEVVARLRGYPQLAWHVLSEYMVLDGGTDPTYSAGTGTLTGTIPDNVAAFLPEADPEWVDMITYSEAVSEAPGMPMVKRPSPWFWHEWSTQPTCVELIGLMNAIPRLRIPKAAAIGTVIF